MSIDDATLFQIERMLKLVCKDELNGSKTTQFIIRDENREEKKSILQYKNVIICYSLKIHYFD